MADPKNPDRPRTADAPREDPKGSEVIADARTADAPREDPKGSEVIADAQRTDDDAPRVHGHGWREREPRDGREQLDAKDDPDPEAPEGDAAIDDPGTRGAVFGKGGRGLVARAAAGGDDDDGTPAG